MGGSNFQGTAGAWGATNNRTTSAQANLLATINNTFYITGVQLEKGSTATSFDYRPYGTELALCQRYYESQSARTYITYLPGSLDSVLYGSWSVEKRATPTLTLSSTTQLDTATAGVVPTKSWIAGKASGGTANTYVGATITAAAEL
jgi:hypothetical protein